MARRVSKSDAAIWSLSEDKLTLLTAGQTVGGITDIPAIAILIRRLVAEAEAALARASSLVAGAPGRMHVAGADA
jgi:hypothetical protein